MPENTKKHLVEVATIDHVSRQVTIDGETYGIQMKSEGPRVLRVDRGTHTDLVLMLPVLIGSYVDVTGLNGLTVRHTAAKVINRHGED